MKKLHLLGMAMIIALAFASCGSEKQMVNPTKRTPREIPCFKESRSDENYFREMGVGKHVFEANAKVAAVKNAKELMRLRLGGLVQGVSEDYSRSISGDAPSNKVESVIEDGFNQVITKMLDDADNGACEAAYDENDGEISYYYVIQISKNRLKEEVAEELAKRKELETLFHKEQFFEKYGNILRGMNTK